MKEFQQPINRREFLQKGGRLLALGGIAGTTGYAVKRGVDQLLLPAYETSIDWHEAGLSNDEFLKENPQIRDNLVFGTSFAPEMFGVTPQDDGATDGRKKKALTALDYAVRTLGMKDIRFGIRWSNSVEEKSGRIDLSFYEDYLDYLVREGVNTCIGLGYKVFRWPEQHPPEFVVNQGILPPHGSAIRAYDPLGEAALSHIHLLSRELQRKYGNSFGQFQVENEPFLKFGEYDHQFEYDYLIRGVETVNQYHPHAKFLFNTAGSGNIREINKKFMPYFNKKLPHLRDRKIFGLDFYFDKPDYNEPIVGRAFGGVTRGEMKMGDVYGENIELAKDAEYETEITEQQFENWGDRVAPGEDARYFRFTTKRVSRALDLSKPARSRLWGIEKFFENIQDEMTYEHQMMEDLIYKVNFKE